MLSKQARRVLEVLAVVARPIDGNLAVLVRAEVQGSPREQQVKNALAAIEGTALPERRSSMCEIWRDRLGFY